MKEVKILLDESDYNKLWRLKIKKGLTWRGMLLSLVD
jgi:hypothetical protein